MTDPKETLPPSPDETIDDTELKLRRRLFRKRPVTRNKNKEFEETLTFGQRLADRVSAFGGSWPFLIIFGLVLLIWIGLNSYILVGAGAVFDPYPYILLNLVLSMLAAVQAPVILMSQNRHAAKDRLNAEHDYEINLKAELEIMALHEKLDILTQRQWQELIAIQQEQIKLLMEIVRTGTTDKLEKS